MADGRIYESDIKFVESQVMDDVPEGGGTATGRVIEDGQVNNVFNDIPDLAWVLGEYSMRKVFVDVQSQNTALFGGAKSLITDLPKNGNLSYTIFSYDNSFDTRYEAAQRVQAYMYKSVEWNGFLMGGHIKGQAMLQLFQRPGTALPQPGQTLALIAAEGLQGEYEQYVRVARASAEERLFYDEATKQDFSAQIVTVELTSSLQYDFSGTEPNRKFSRAQGAAILRETSVVDAGRYFGATRLKEAATLGDRRVGVDAIMTRLVPASQSETPLVDVQTGGTSAIVMSGGARSVTIPQISHTHRIDIIAQNQGNNYVMMLSPLPGAQSLVVHYRSQGQRYTLRDLTGDGTLTGDGSGRVNYMTGSVQVTTLELPDVNSALIAQWGSTTHYQRRERADIDLPAWSFRTQKTGVVPGSVRVSWEVDGVLKTVTDDGDGNFVGDGTGRFNYAVGTGYLRPSTLPEAGSQPKLEYEASEQVQDDFNPAADANGALTLQLTRTPVKPGSVVLQWECSREQVSTEKA